MGHPSKKRLTSPRPELILEIASYFSDDYVYCQPTNDIFIESTESSTSQAPYAPPSTVPPPISTPTFCHICPNAAFAITNRHFWSVIPRPLSCPIPLEIIEEAET